MLKLTDSSSKINTDKILVEADSISNKLADYPNAVYFLFYFFSTYMVLPFIEVPFLNISLSAPIFFMIFVACVVKPPTPWFRPFRQWIFLAAFIWIGIFFSTTFNGVLSFGVDINNKGVAGVIQYAYWLLVFVITTYFASQGKILLKIAKILGFSIFVLAILRWVEALIFGRIGAWSGTEIMYQNDYGFQFSSFSPFLLIMIFQQRGWKRFFAILINLVLWGAVAVNGSRGSWVSMVVGLCITLIMLLVSKPGKFFGLVIILLIVAGLVITLGGSFPQISNAVENRLASFETLDKDKSTLIRELMIQKGLTLFKESPIIGVGASRFKEEIISLNIPRELSYGSQAYFNRKSSHNSYIQFLAEFGLIGSIPFALFIIILLFRSIKPALKSLKLGNMVPAAILISLIQMSIHMWVISSITNSGNWFVYGLVGAQIMNYHKARGVQAIKEAGIKT